MTTYLIVSATLILVTFALLTVMNRWFLRRLTVQQPSARPFVSILIPARNEAAVIGQTVAALTQQTYPHFELLILDDQSTDGTSSIARAAGDQRTRILTGRPLPSGWAGKNWACWQLAQEARGELLLFTDADTRWQPDALAALLSHQQTTNADLLTAWPTQITHTWAERLIVPLMSFVIMAYLPIVMTHHGPFVIFGAANGQCMLWRRAAYQRVGGHRAVAPSVLDDVNLARAVKRHGLRLRMADANGLIACRMYDSWRAVRDGFAKNILAGYGSSVLLLLLGALLHFGLYLLPWGLLLSPEWRAWGLAMIALGISARALSAAYSRQRVLDALLLPVSVLLMQRIALHALYWHFTGGPRWKGRTLPQTKEPPSWGHEAPSSSAQASGD
jgi:chlorobactene glucosyltransferase